jgi:hypothetical protein
MASGSVFFSIQRYKHKILVFIKNTGQTTKMSIIGELFGIMGHGMV